MRTPLLAICVVVVSSAAAFGDFTVGGNRPVVVREPANVSPDLPAPLLILLHGFTGNGAGQESYWSARAAAEERGVLLTYPDGMQNSGQNRFWNATNACCDFDPTGVDDSRYLRGLIEEIEATVSVDPDRIYVAGLSNGGFMSHRMACDHADKVAAIASQAGATFFDPADCVPSSPVHILQIHGTSDSTILYGGGAISGERYPAAVTTVALWAQDNECSGEPELLDLSLDIDSSRPGAETNVRRYTGCPEGGAVELWSIVGGAHVPNLTRNGPSTNLAHLVIDWLLAHPKRPSPEASFTAEPSTGAAPLEVGLDVSESTAPAGTTIARYHWDFGDGTSGEGGTVSHTYGDPGVYDVSLIVVTDDGRVSARVSHTVVVACGGDDTTPWTSSHVGEPAVPGGATGGSASDSGALQICAAGAGISTRDDELFFLHQVVSGDFRLTALLPDMTNLGRAVAGVMARQSLEATAPFAATFLEPGTTTSRFRFRYREELEGRARSTAGESFETGGWVRLERSGEVFSGASSSDGQIWVPFESQVIEGAAESMLVGIAAASRDASGNPVQLLVEHLELTTFDSRPTFARGDANGDGHVDISDAGHLLNWLLVAGVELPCRASGDANGDSRVDIADVSYVLGFLFADGEAPPAPYPECGPGTAADGQLGCGEAPACR